MNGVKYIKDEDQRVPVTEKEIRERPNIYFDKFFNGSDTKNWSKLSNQIEDSNHRLVQRIMTTKVKDNLRRMKTGKAVGPDEILIEVCKCLSDVVVC